MSDTKWTPGPWEVHPLAPYAVHQPEFSCWIPQDKHDAHLIAAAPRLYAALYGALVSLENTAVKIEGEWGTGRTLEKIEADGDLDPEIIEARAALVQARGES